MGENHANIFKYPGDIVARVNKVIDENADSVIIYISNLMRNNIWNKFAPFQCYEGTLQAELVKGLHVNSVESMGTVLMESMGTVLIDSRCLALIFRDNAPI